MRRLRGRLVRRPGKRELVDSPGEIAAMLVDGERTRYESHVWSPLTDEDEDECVVCGITWSECEADCPGPPS